MGRILRDESLTGFRVFMYSIFEVIFEVGVSIIMEDYRVCESAMDCVFGRSVPCGANLRSESRECGTMRC